MLLANPHHDCPADQEWHDTNSRHVRVDDNNKAQGRRDPREHDRQPFPVCRIIAPQNPAEPNFPPRVVELKPTLDSHPFGLVVSFGRQLHASVLTAPIGACNTAKCALAANVISGINARTTLARSNAGQPQVGLA